MMITTLSLLALAAVLVLAVPPPIYEDLVRDKSGLWEKLFCVVMVLGVTGFAFAGPWFASALFYRPDQVVPLFSLVASSVACGFTFSWMCLQSRNSKIEDLAFKMRRRAEGVEHELMRCRDEVVAERFFIDVDDMKRLLFIRDNETCGPPAFGCRNTQMSDWKFRFLRLTKKVDIGEDWTPLVALTEKGEKFLEDALRWKNFRGDPMWTESGLLEEVRKMEDRLK